VAGGGSDGVREDSGNDAAHAQQPDFQPGLDRGGGLQRLNGAAGAQDAYRHGQARGQRGGLGVDLDLVAVGADADEWLGFAQAFAGPSGEGRAAVGSSGEGRASKVGR